MITIVAKWGFKKLYLIKLHANKKKTLFFILLALLFQSLYKKFYFFH